MKDERENARHLLRQSLQNTADIAARVAERERSQLDEYTAKIRFGSVSLNAVSLVTAASVVPTFAGLTAGNALTACGFFLVGSIAGGISLSSHQVMLIRTAGKATAWHMHASRAVSLVDSEPGTQAHVRLGEAIADADNAVAEGVFEPGISASRSQVVSVWSWVGGMISIAAAAILAQM